MTCPPDVAKRLDVSRETLERLERYVSLLEKWNPRINLVSAGTLVDVWHRHILDSAQVFRLKPKSVPKWVDLGSGGGFPGAVAAIMAGGTDQKTTLVEADQRKAAFLRTVLRECDVEAKVLAQRIEKTEPQNADVISARALAALPTLLAFCERHLGPGGIALFPKGSSAAEEVAAAQETWSFDLETVPSITDADAMILKIGDIKRV